MPEHRTEIAPGQFTFDGRDLVGGEGCLLGRISTGEHRRIPLDAIPLDWSTTTLAAMGSGPDQVIIAHQAP